MIPVPIPNELVPEGYVRRVFAAPDGDLTNPDIRPVEVLARKAPGMDTAEISVHLILEGDELERLNAGGSVWLIMLGGLMPFQVEVSDWDPGVEVR